MAKSSTFIIGGLSALSLTLAAWSLWKPSIPSASIAEDEGRSLAKKTVIAETPVDIAIPETVSTKEAEIRRLFDEKKYQEALLLLENELRSPHEKSIANAYKEWLERNRSTIKTAIAWGFLEKQNCAAAMTIFEDIPDATRPTLALKGMGYCKYMTRDWQEADAYLSSYLQVQENDQESLGILAKVKDAKGEFEEALEISEKISSENADEEAELEIEPLRKSLRAKQSESENQLLRQGSFFTLHYQPNLSPDFLDKVSETIQKLAQKLSQSYGIPTPEKPIEIFLHASENFQTITHGPSWVGGLYDGQIRLPVKGDGILDEDVIRGIRHELTHALISELVGRRNLPTWFQEGFAQMAECEELCTGFDYAATTQKFMPMEKFELAFTNLSKREAQVAYKQSLYMSLLLVHYRKEADIKQMFSLLPTLENLSSKDLLQAAGWDFPLLYQSCKNAWEKQTSLRDITGSN